MSPRSRLARTATGLALALACGGAAAQSATLSLYGRLNLNVEAVNGRLGDGSNPRVYRTSSNSSAFGIRGAEYLGDGVVALFQIESAVQADVGGSTIASRETYVGLDAPWGTVKVGYFLAPYDDIHPIFGNAPTLNTSILSTASLWAQGYAAKNIGGFDARLPNSIRYDSPDYSGFTASAQLSVGEGSDYPGGLHAMVLSSAAFYTNGALQLGLGYERNRRVRQNPVPGGAALNDQAASLTGAWDFGAVRLAGIFEYIDYDAPRPTGARSSLTRTFWGVSATAPLGPGTAYAFFGRAGEGRGTAAIGTRVAGLARGPSTGADQWEISYTYSMSKRTQVYGGYVRIDNDENASYTFNSNPYATAIGGKPAGFVLGMVHFF
jgi:predicted porin